MTTHRTFIKLDSQRDPQSLVKSDSESGTFEVYYIDRSIPAVPSLRYVCLITHLPVGFTEITDSLDLKFWNETVKEL